MDIKLQELINRTKNKKEMQMFLQIERISITVFVTLLLTMIIK